MQILSNRQHQANDINSIQQNLNVDQTKNHKVLLEQKRLLVWKSLADGSDHKMLQATDGKEEHHSFLNPYICIFGKGAYWSHHQQIGAKPKWR